MQNNVRVNDTIFQFLSIVSGIVTGCLGLTDLKGLAAFLAFNCLIALAVVVKTGFDVKGHFLSFDKILVNGASASAGTFILFWTLFYNICISSDRDRARFASAPPRPRSRAMYGFGKMGSTILGSMSDLSLAGGAQTRRRPRKLTILLHPPSTPYVTSAA